MRLKAPFLAGFPLLACGARSSLVSPDVDAPDAGDGGTVEPPVLCSSDPDCDLTDRCEPEACVSGTCQVQTRVSCDDADVCTEDLCEPTTGTCTNTSLRHDDDSDGYWGIDPGTPQRCGDDCDDQNANVHPGEMEFCDGADNDCNGQVDEGSTYQPVVDSELRISADDMQRAGRAGFAFTGTDYAVTYTGKRATWQSYLLRLAADGSAIGALGEVSDVNSGTYAGPLLWDGASFHTAWSDARQDGNYEIYFNRFDPTGKKLGPDVRVTDAENFSLHPDLALGPEGPVVVWDDRRPIPNGAFESSAIFAQRLSSDGSLIKNNVLLTPIENTTEYPTMAFGKRRSLVAFTYLSGEVALGGYRTLDLDFGAPSGVMSIPGEHVQSPAVHYYEGHFILTWETYDILPGPAILGMTLDEDGNVLAGPVTLTTGAAFARTHSLLPIGNQLLLVWADTFDGNYELYYESLDLNLSVLTSRTRITDDPSDTLAPLAVAGANGDVSIVFDDWRTGTNQVYFTRLSCQAPE